VEKPDDTDLQALMYLSIDGFAQLQATLGADAIDASLDAAIERLQAHISKDDVLSRFDDSTLTLLCRRPAADAIDRFGEELRAQIAAQPLPEGSAENHLSASIGIAFMTVPITDKTAFIDEARRASQSARREGGNRVALARIKDGGETPDMEIVAQITHALEKDRFALVYQPIVSLQGDSRENYAVLVRLLGENEEELLPEKFIQQAERYHKMVDIDRWIIRQAIATLAKQRKEGRKVNFFISLSEPALLDKNLLLWVCDCLREFDARGGWLTFQIREQHVRDNLRAVTKLIEGLKKIKCQIALDHFGLLAKPDILLNHIEVDFIKLAPQLVSNINNDQAKQDALNDLNELIMGTGVKTIAMAVEDANSLTVLWTVGVGYIQGFFLQEPSRTIEYGSQQLI
jgi:diguanylate cyclase (GGDEF)-like protein